MQHHFLPHPRNPFFTGRQQVLTDLDTLFASLVPNQKIAELVGMSGIGKTEIALEYVYRSLQTYPTIIWLRASSSNHLVDSIIEALDAFGVEVPARRNEWQVFEIFRMWLHLYQSNCLLILDDLDDYFFVRKIIDEDFRGYTIITSNSSQYKAADESNVLVVDPFDDEIGPLFLLRRAGLLSLKKLLNTASRSARQSAYAIHQEFGGHPLALDQAGAYVAQTGIPLAEYLPLYRQDKRALLIRRGTSSASHPFSAFDAVNEMRTGYAYFAQKLLRLYVLEDLDPSDPSPHLSPPLVNKVVPDGFTFVELRNMLIQKFLLLPLDIDRTRWSIHPLVRVVMLEILVYEEVQSQRMLKEDERYEPLSVEEIYQILVDAQQKKKRISILPGSPERRALAVAITVEVPRLRCAVLPGDPKQREAQKQKIEQRYATLVLYEDAPIFDASESDLRGYAQELFALMHYEEG